jgi:hypothetical protein
MHRDVPIALVGTLAAFHSASRIKRSSGLRSAGVVHDVKQPQGTNLAVGARTLTVAWMAWMGFARPAERIQNALQGQLAARVTYTLNLGGALWAVEALFDIFTTGLHL